MPIPKNIKAMPEPMRTLVIESTKMAGKYHPADEALEYCFEQFTEAEYKKAKAFLEWLHKNTLTIGHGTIALRYHEFTHNLTPASRDEAYQFAMKQMGL